MQHQQLHIRWIMKNARHDPTMPSTLRLHILQIETVWKSTNFRHAWHSGNLWLSRSPHLSPRNHFLWNQINQSNRLCDLPNFQRCFKVSPEMESNLNLRQTRKKSKLNWKRKFIGNCLNHRWMKFSMEQIFISEKRNWIINCKLQLYWNGFDRPFNDQRFDSNCRLQF